MDPDHSIGFFLPILVSLLFFAAFFSAAETAIVGLSSAKARSLISQKKHGAKAVIHLKDHQEKALVTILIGSNLVNAAFPVFATVFFTNIFGDNILGILTGALATAMLIFGEIIPKTFAQKFPATFSLFIAPPLLIFQKIFFPVVWILEKVLKIIGAQKNEKIFSDEELLALAEIGEEEGTLESDERERIENVLEFGETTAKEIMTPRPSMDVLAETTTLKQAVEYFLSKTHSRIPVFRSTIDQISGVFTLKDIMKFEQNFPPETQLSKLPKNPVLTIPTSMVLEDILREMKWRRTHMAIVIDEHGGTAGLVTLEDLLEEVFGEIEDETDPRKAEIKKMPDQSYLIPGDSILEDIEEETGLQIPGEESENIAKVILDTLGRFPKRGEKVPITPKIFAVIERIEEYKILSVRLFMNGKKK
jgi:putative hemolysin